MIIVDECKNGGREFLFILVGILGRSYTRFFGKISLYVLHFMIAWSLMRSRDVLLKLGITFVLIPIDLVTNYYYFRIYNYVP